MASSYSILLMIVFTNFMMVFLMSTAFAIPGVHSPFDDFSGLGIPSSSTMPGSGTVNAPDPTQIQQAKAVSSACGAGVIGGAVGGAVIGSIVPGLGTLVGAGVGALAGGVLGCLVAPTNPAGTAQFLNSVGAAIPGANVAGDALSTLGILLQYVFAFFHFVVDMALYSLLIWAYDPTIGLFFSPFSAMTVFFLGYVAINVARGRGG